MINTETLFKISYGLYIVCSGNKTEGNGFISNTVFQISSQPAKFAISCNKNNYTGDLIKKHNNFSVSVLGSQTPKEIFSCFAYRSGKGIDKFEGKEIRYGQSGVPIVLDSAIATLEFSLENTYDEGTHIIFIGTLVESTLIDNNAEAMTYCYYREHFGAKAQKNAPTYIEDVVVEENSTQGLRYKCTICNYIHDNANESTEFVNLPEDWTCPLCGAEKSEFTEI